MRIALASDHAGAVLKADLVQFVASLGHETADLGADGSCSVDYPDFALKAAEGVAAGRFDGYFEHSLGAWDMAAGTLIVREAGGHVTDVVGNPQVLQSKGIVAGNASIHKALLAILEEARAA